jgi:hypothetical protein
VAPGESSLVSIFKLVKAQISVFRVALPVAGAVTIKMALRGSDNQNGTGKPITTLFDSDIGCKTDLFEG